MLGFREHLLDLGRVAIAHGGDDVVGRLGQTTGAPGLVAKIDRPPTAASS